MPIDRSEDLLNRQLRARPLRFAPLLLAAAALLLVGLIGPASSSAAVYFKNRTDFTTEELPDSVAIGDLNGDGIPDLVVTNWGSGTVSVLLGTGHGNYEPQRSFAAGGRPDGVVIRDFNGDGVPDLAVTSETNNAVSILLGDGTGAFGAPTSFSVGLYPRALALGDFNGDGVPDLAVVSSGSQTITILLGNGAGSFSLKGTLSTGRTPYAVKVGDFNGDGKLDLAVVNFSENNVGVYLGAGNGTFSAAGTFATGSFPQALAIGDFNGDGKPDLAVANEGSNNVSVLLGDGTGSFAAQATYATGNVPTSIGVGDLDGDGHPDIVVGNQGASSISVLLGIGDGSFAAQSVFEVLRAPAALAVGDLDGDGKPDLAVINESAGRGSVLLSGKAVPSISTNASSPIALGGQISDSATVSEGSLPTGTVTFSVYGLNDANCSATPANVSTVGISGNGTVGSTAFTPAAPGTYRFVASYSGDSHNEGALGACNDANESILVSKATPGIASEASASVALGGQISDEMTISGGQNPGGTIVFKAYGPEDATCALSPAFTSPAVTVSGNGSYASPAFTPSAPGTYRFVGSYSGDANNEAAAGACNDANESVTVGKAAPTISTEASGPVALGGQISDEATLAGGQNPGGTIVFKAYGPEDATCSSAPAYTSAPVTVGGNGSYTSPAFTPSAPGTYRFVASYSGDAGNSATTGACSDPDGSVTVGRSTTSTSLEATPNPAPLGGPVTLTARVAGFGPTGTVTFSDGAASLGSAILGADGTASLTTTGLAVGSHQLSAAYSGDAGNLPSTSSALAEAITAPATAAIVPTPVAPAVRISYSPNHPHAPNPKRGPRYTFHFADQAAGTTFFCRIDKAPFEPCGSPMVYRQLSRGRHVFAVKSVDTSGAESATQTVRFVAGKRRH
jgi:hypothetical protein